MKAKDNYAASKWIPCKRCNATGKVACTKCSGTGKHVTGVLCHLCKGIERVECNACDGEGRVRKLERVKVNIPAGVEDEMKLKINSKGEVGKRGSSSGDLFVVLNVKDSDIFLREENDILLKFPLSFSSLKTERCICGPVVLPVIPTLLIISPFSTSTSPESLEMIRSS